MKEIAVMIALALLAIAVLTGIFVAISSCDRKPMEWRGAPPGTVCPVSSDLGKRCVGGGKVLWCVESFRDDVITCAPLPGGGQ